MVDSVGSTGGGALLVAAMKNTDVSQAVGFAVLKKNQDVDRANGEAALALIASAAPTVSSEHIDVHV